jgi:hypothetical protein
MLSLLMAFYHFTIFAYLWEKQGFRQYDKDDFLDETEKVFKKSGKDILFWFSKEKLEGIKNPIKRNLQKMSDRVRGI